MPDFKNRVNMSLSGLRVLKDLYFCCLHLKEKAALVLLVSLFISGCVFSKNDKNEATRVDGIAPSTGSLAGGTLVTVLGNNFTPEFKVTIGKKVCVLVSSTPTKITCTTPPNTAGVVDVEVTGDSKRKQNFSLPSSFTYAVFPELTVITPSRGPIGGGVPVSIIGSSFTENSTVTFGGDQCTDVVVVNGSLITCTVPAHAAGVADVTVRSSDNQSVTKVGGYTFLVAPTISNVTGNSGALGGDTGVTITGSGFVASPSVTIGGSPCANMRLVNSTSITCKTPSHAAGSVDVVVTNPDNQSGTLAAGFTYRAAPTVAILNITSGLSSGGSSVTITGSGFVAIPSVSFGGSACSVNAVNATTITCTTSAHVAGPVAVVVTNPDTQSGTLAGGFTYRAAPTLTAVSSNAGALGGGTLVTISGTGFYSTPTVKFAGISCTGVTLLSSTSLTCTTPTHAAGMVNVVVTNPDNQSATLVNGFLYRAAPTLTSIYRNSGTLAGGTRVTIIGTGFVATPSVTLGGSACYAVTFESSTSITCTTTAHAPGAVNVVVTNPDNQFATLVNEFTYKVAPAITSVNNDGGPLTGGTAVTITGTGFVATATVTFGGNACNAVTIVSATFITCTTPVHASGAVDVVVTNPDTQSGTKVGGFTYRVAPTLTSVSFNSGALAGGTAVTIRGTGFAATPTVSFGGSACSAVTFISATSLTCTTTTHAAGAVSVVITNSDNQFGTLVNGFTYRAAPTVTSVANNAGTLAGGTVVTITGTGFVASPTVTFDGSACSAVTLVSATSIRCTTPAHASGAVDVIVTNPDAQSGTKVGGFTYQVAPTVTLINVTSGFAVGGTAVIITGTGFIATPTITFGGSACSVTLESSTSISCTTTAHAAGVVNVIVKNSDNQFATLANGYTYHVAPTVTNVANNAGALAGATAVTITGTGFVATPTVTFGGTACSAVILVSATSITCTTPAHALGPVDVIVTNPDTQSGTLSNGFTYQAAPVVTSVYRNSGALAGGMSVTIAGSGFVNNATISFGGSACSNVVYADSTSIACTTTAHVAGPITVTVTNRDNQVGTLSNGYTYRAAPTVTAVNSSSGGLTGGSTVTITGTGFVANPVVDFGGSSCTGVTFESATSITCTTSAHVAGVVSVRVDNPDTQSGTKASGYTYRAAPTVISVMDNGGPASGLMSVTITGSGFYTGASANFGTIACSLPVVVSSTSMTCTTPAHALGAVNVVVTNTDTQTGTLLSGYAYRAPPTVTSVTRNAGALAGGTLVTIAGTGFIATPTVTFEAIPCTGVSFISANSITCTTPAHAAGGVSVVVKNSDTQIGSLAFGYTYQPVPTVTTVSPNIAPLLGEVDIIITGTNFVGSTVSVGGTNCPVLSSTATTISCRTPPHTAGSVSVTVTNSDTQSGSKGSAFTYYAAPTVTSIYPNGGVTAGGTTVTITGTGFIAGATIMLGTSTCTPSSIAATSIVCTTSARAAEVVTVFVTNPDGQSGDELNAYAYRATPTLTNISPATGTLNGQTLVTLTGTNFVTGTSVTIGAVDCTSVNILGPTSLTCLTGSHAAGLVPAIVKVAPSVTATLSSFTYTSMADLEWQVGTASPTPPDPDSFGSTTVDVTHTYTLKNIGDVSTSTITLSVTTPAIWVMAADDCSGAGNALGPSETCTVQVIFKGSTVAVGSYINTLTATAATGGTSTHVMSGTKP